VFQPAKVLAEIADCVGGNVRPDIVFQLHSSKQHGSGTDYIKAITKTADVNARSQNMTIHDFEFASIHLDPQLMKMFRYVHPPDLQ
jgi:hypothetical protein